MLKPHIIAQICFDEAALSLNCARVNHAERWCSFKNTSYALGQTITWHKGFFKTWNPDAQHVVSHCLHEFFHCFQAKRAGSNLAWAWTYLKNRRKAELEASDFAAKWSYWWRHHND